MKSVVGFIKESLLIAIGLVLIIASIDYFTSIERSIFHYSIYSIILFLILSIVAFTMVTFGVRSKSNYGFMLGLIGAFIVKTLLGLAGFLGYFFIVGMNVKIFIIPFLLSYAIFTIFATMRLTNKPNNIE